MLLRVKNAADKTKVPGKNNTGLQTVLTAAQAVRKQWMVDTENMSLFLESGI